MKTNRTTAIIRKIMRSIWALTLCVPLWAGEAEVAQFEVPMRSQADRPMEADSRADKRAAEKPATERTTAEKLTAEKPSLEKPGAETVPDQSYVAPGTAKSATRDADRKLNIYVLVGERAVNNITTQSATAPIVEVRDARNLPVAGAEVKFQLPGAGPGGFFPGQQLTWMGTTDANGQVVAASFTPNRETGQFTIAVTAIQDGRQGIASIRQRNSLNPADVSTGSRWGKHSRFWKIAAVAAAGGVVGGIVWATQRGNSTPTIILQPGSVSLGGPR